MNIKELNYEELIQALGDAENEVTRLQMEMAARLKGDQLFQAQRKSWEAVFNAPSMRERSQVDAHNKISMECDDHEPGEPIVECSCPNCGARLDITYGDDPGEISVVSEKVDAACSPGCPGLAVFEKDFSSPKGFVHIERCDVCNRYSEDLAAAKSISPAAMFWCIDCKEFGSCCRGPGSHRWRAVVPVYDAEHAGLLGPDSRAALPGSTT